MVNIPVHKCHRIWISSMNDEIMRRDHYNLIKNSNRFKSPPIFQLKEIKYTRDLAKIYNQIFNDNIEYINKDDFDNKINNTNLNIISLNLDNKNLCFLPKTLLQSKIFRKLKFLSLRNNYIFLSSRKHELLLNLEFRKSTKHRGFPVFYFQDETRIEKRIENMDKLDINN